MKIRYTLPRFVEELHLGASILLSHFHYYNGDMDPFNLDWKHRYTTRLAHLSSREASFLIFTSEVVKNNGTLNFSLLSVTLVYWANELCTDSRPFPYL
jgi:hypothetical protein